MVEDTHNIILDYLRELRAGQDRIEITVRDVKAELSSIRQHIHAVSGDGMRQEERLSRLETDIDRIKTRLDLSDA